MAEGVVGGEDSLRWRSDPYGVLYHGDFSQMNLTEHLELHFLPDSYGNMINTLQQNCRAIYHLQHCYIVLPQEQWILLEIKLEVHVIPLSV
jgi:hypothetical protein